jgi:hypothetical protein
MFTGNDLEPRFSSSRKCKENLRCSARHTDNPPLREEISVVSQPCTIARSRPLPSISAGAGCISQASFGGFIEGDLHLLARIRLDNQRLADLEDHGRFQTQLHLLVL